MVVVKGGCKVNDLRRHDSMRPRNTNPFALLQKLCLDVCLDSIVKVVGQMHKNDSLKGLGP